MRTKRVLGAVLIALFVFIGIRLADSFTRFWKVEKQFAQIEIGKSQSYVVANIGRPNYYVGSCGSIMPSVKSCFVEYIYSHPFAPYMPDYYIVEFSSDGNVVYTYHTVSP
jgi:hypothetical protein